MDGVLIIDKPEGVTSHDVVAVARRVLGEKRIGHTGTLDPLATGVLPLACGRATRLVRFLTASDKEYDASILFGVTTDTLDITGTETSRSGAAPSREALIDALASLTGEYLQMPPAYSAKKVGGRRAYELARRDEPVALTAAPVRVRRLELLEAGDDRPSTSLGARCRISLTCSAGFYVRSLVRDLGERCGTGACLEALRRTRSGDFRIDEAIPLDALEVPLARRPVQRSAQREVGSSKSEGGNPGRLPPDPGTDLATLLIPMEKLLPDFPAVTVTSEGLARISHGQLVRASDLVGSAPPGPAEWVRLLDGSGALVGLGTPVGGRGLLDPPRLAPGVLHPGVVLI
jgi:tRNA pseudouridine55 synthase